MIKESIEQEDTTFANIYAPQREAPKYIKKANEPKGRDWQQYRHSGKF